jgi:hypothetical protein
MDLPLSSFLGSKLAPSRAGLEGEGAEKSIEENSPSHPEGIRPDDLALLFR